MPDPRYRRRPDPLEGRLPARPRAPLEVRTAPQHLTIGSRLTDGSDGYEVIDAHKRHGGMWYRLMNLTTGANAWFAYEDVAELYYGKGTIG